MATKLAGGLIVAVFLIKAALNIAGVPDEEITKPVWHLVGQEAVQ